MRLRRGSSAKAALALATLALAACTAVAAGSIAFRHIAFETPLDVTPLPDEAITDAVRRFRASGENPYAGDPKAAADGRALYETWCQSCHLPDGSGRIGPSLVDPVRIYPRAATDVGLFEAIYGGALGAMQPFRGRMTQDEMLRLIAYLRVLQKR